MPHPITTAELEDLIHNPDSEIRIFAKEALADARAARQRQEDWMERRADCSLDLETMVTSYCTEMNEPELRAWSARAVEVMDRAMWVDGARAVDRRGEQARIARRASKMRREAYQMAA